MPKVQGILSRLTPAVILLALAAAWPAGAQDFPFQLPTDLQPRGAPAATAKADLFHRVDAGGIRVVIRLKVEEGYHLYHTELGPDDAVGKPLVVRMGPEDVAWSALRLPEPHKFPQPGLGTGGRDTWIYGHEKTLLIYVKGRAQKPDPATNVRADLEGLTCKAACIPYQETVLSQGSGPDALFAQFPTDLAVGPGTDVTPATPPRPGPASTGDTTDYDALTFPDYQPQQEPPRHGLAIWLLLAFLAGMILNVMPCVLPVVSIKVLSFVNQAGEDRKRVLLLGIMFALGMMVVFWGIAVAAIQLGLTWGAQFQSDAFKIVMLAVVFAFALSMLGVYEFGVPSKVGQLATVRREGPGHAFFMGILATLLATPCSGPFLGATMTWALAQPALTVFLVFTSLGLGMAMPYVVLTANPAMLKLLPKPGEWMLTFKVLMGFLLLVTVIYLMVSVRQDNLLYVNSLLVFIGLACALWGKYGAFGKPPSQRVGAFVAAAAVVVLGACLSFGTFKGMFSPRAGSGDHIVWEDFDYEKFTKYQADGRNIFLDFSASWCPNCKYNEHFVFETDDVRALIKKKNVVTIKADLTHSGPRERMIERLRLKLGGTTVPYLAIFPADQPTRPHTRPDIVRKDTIKKILKSLP